jgi:protein TonB
MLLAIPLMATAALPVPKSRSMGVAVLAPPLPSPPPAPRAAAPPSAAKTDAAPIVTPESIAPGPEIDAFETDSTAAGGIVAGVGMDRIDAVIAEPPSATRPVAPAPVRVGGVTKMPEKIRDVPPAYPQMAIAAHIEGMVIVEATIGVDGRVQDAGVLRSVPLFDQAALDAVRQWIDTPTMLNGVAVPVVMTVTVRFQLQR